MIGAITAAIPLVGKILDRVLPDEGAREKARLELTNLLGSQELDRLDKQLSAIIAEAKSSDPWTSRARPSFLYVVYIFILSAIPMGFLFAFEPVRADAVVAGVALWLNAIPDPMWALFGTGYLGYTAARSWDKGRIEKTKREL